MIRPLIIGALAALAAGPAFAADPFFKGKTVTIITSTGAGGTYDTVARAVARHMPRHLQGEPTMIVQNMPGGGHMRATNYMYNVAPKDGTRLATIHNAVPLHQVIDGRGVRFDVTKFNWLGSTGPDNSGIIVWHTAKVKTYDDLLKQEVILGGTGPGSGIVLFPKVMNAVLGTKFKIVIGYKSSEQINIAMERGEVEARAFGLTSIFAQRAYWVKEKKIRFLAQVGAKRDPRIADVPLLTELAKTEEQRQILKLVSSPTALGRPYIAPPGLPPGRVAVLRKAFDETFADAKFIEQMNKLKVAINYVPGPEVAELVQATVDTPAEFVEKAKKVIPKKKRRAKKKKKTN
ncbi:MAG TPA: tripartite tricarboxylate transporter substrate-binding protein [Alphaproteobacteria bacterium]|nr:tripartite tricarboxylate transporter substrate-binding protein [Alphaproteobacteria bacterium]